VKVLRVAWDIPPDPPDYYILRWPGHSRETHGNETEIDVPDDFAGNIEVVAVENGVESGPCVAWFEDFSLLIRWDDFHKCVIVSLPTDERRRYCIERSTDQGRTWAEFAEFNGTGQAEEVGGGTEKDARFRCWSLPLKTNVGEL